MSRFRIPDLNRRRTRLRQPRPARREAALGVRAKSEAVKRTVRSDGRRYRFGMEIPPSDSLVGSEGETPAAGSKNQIGLVPQGDCRAKSNTQLATCLGLPKLEVGRPFKGLVEGYESLAVRSKGGRRHIKVLDGQLPQTFARVDLPNPGRRITGTRNQARAVRAKRHRKDGAGVVGQGEARLACVGIPQTYRLVDAPAGDPLPVRAVGDCLDPL